MEEVDSGVKVAVETEVKSESVVAESKRPEAQQTVSLAQPEAPQGRYFYNQYCLDHYMHNNCFYLKNIFQWYVISIL